MDSLWRTMLWKQFGAAIDMLDNAVIACPDALWRQPVWHDPSYPPTGPEFWPEFWRIAYHAVFWLDLYLFGSEQGFAPPAPFRLTEQDDSSGQRRNRPFSREELRTYLAYARENCRTTIETITDEQARQPVNFDWMREGEVVSYLELQLYSMRHIQEHAAQLSLLLGHHGVSDEALDWVTRAG
ncbi:MAG: DinB family protein [Ktedonobacterales bacterium]